MNLEQSTGGTVARFFITNRFNTERNLESEIVTKNAFSFSSFKFPPMKSHEHPLFDCSPYLVYMLGPYGTVRGIINSVTDIIFRTHFKN